MFIDVHCHLDMLQKEGVTVQKAVSTARKKGVTLMVVNGTTPERNAEVFALGQEFKEITAAMGMYPIDALELSERQIKEEMAFIRENTGAIGAIGEIGLDLKEETLHKTFDKQKKNFTWFVKLAQELDKPVIVHSRKAELQTIELLEELGARKVIMHCFSGKMSLVDRIVKNGWFLSIPANVKYSQQFQDVVRRVPLMNLFCETDSPYLHPDKAWPNEPANVIESYKKIAHLKGMKLAEVEKVIEDNYHFLFEGALDFITQDTLKKQLTAEGFSNICVVTQGSNADLGTHTHDTNTVHVILEGELHVTDSLGTHIVTKGQRVMFPKGTKHTVRCGALGCSFISAFK